MFGEYVLYCVSHSFGEFIELSKGKGYGERSE